MEEFFLSKSVQRELGFFCVNKNFSVLIFFEVICYNSFNTKGTFNGNECVIDYFHCLSDIC